MWGRWSGDWRGLIKSAASKKRLAPATRLLSFSLLATQCLPRGVQFAHEFCSFEGYVLDTLNNRDKLNKAYKDVAAEFQAL
jgi:hypothetical protein